MPGKYGSTRALSYRPRANLAIKPELGRNWQQRADPRAPGAFNGGRDTHPFLAVREVVLKF